MIAVVLMPIGYAFLDDSCEDGDFLNAISNQRAQCELLVSSNSKTSTSTSTYACRLRMTPKSIFFSINIAPVRRPFGRHELLCAVLAVQPRRRCLADVCRYVSCWNFWGSHSRSRTASHHCKLSLSSRLTREY